jgi:hypothetical protein
VLPSTTDQALEQAVGDGRVILAQVADEYVARLQANYGLKPADFIRAQLPGYPAKIAHTPRQVMLPFMTLYLIDSLTTGDRVAAANQLFEVTFAAGMREVALYFSSLQHGSVYK